MYAICYMWGRYSNTEAELNNSGQHKKLTESIHVKENKKTRKCWNLKRIYIEEIFDYAYVKDWYLQFSTDFITTRRVDWCFIKVQLCWAHVFSFTVPKYEQNVFYCIHHSLLINLISLAL